VSDGPKLIKGGAAADDRGRLSFVNDLDITDCKRAYFVENFAQGTVRAWHAHRNERKWVMAVAGAALVACVKIDDWDDPSPDAEVHRYTLDASIPSALEVPAGYANGAMSLLPGTKLMYLSDATLEETMADDVRFEARHWDPWGIVER
jgi:dTDP-4-dehydrorhamnose 3,5-epimerase